MNWLKNESDESFMKKIIVRREVND